MYKQKNCVKGNPTYPKFLPLTNLGVTDDCFAAIMRLITYLFFCISFVTNLPSSINDLKSSSLVIFSLLNVCYFVT